MCQMVVSLGLIPAASPMSASNKIGEVTHGQILASSLFAAERVSLTTGSVPAPHQQANSYSPLIQPLMWGQNSYIVPANAAAIGRLLVRSRLASMAYGFDGPWVCQS